MRTPDYFDRYDAEEDQDAEGVTCKRCGAHGLEWGSAWDAGGAERRVLKEGSRRHECRAQADDFEDVS